MKEEGYEKYGSCGVPHLLVAEISIADRVTLSVASLFLIYQLVQSEFDTVNPHWITKIEDDLAGSGC